MRTLPRKAKLYILAVYLTGIAAVACARVFPPPAWQSTFWELALFIILAVMAGGKKVRLMRHRSQADVGSMSLGVAIIFASIIRFGPAAGLLVAAISALSGCLYPKRQAIHQLAFNVALTTFQAWVAGLVFLAGNGWTLVLTPVQTIPAVIAATLVYFAINTGGVATIISLCTDQSPIAIWKTNFLWTAPSYFAGASISALAMFLFGRHVGFILLLVSPVAYLTYHSYAIYTARAEEKQQHIEELQLSQAQLADLYLATIKSLALAIDAKDQYTHQHILRVQRYAMATAQKMQLSGADLEGLNTGALLHDIAKLGVPEYVLLKPGRFTPEEFDKIKKHPEIGAAILDPVEFPWPVLPVVKYHHERWDGTGYPEGLKEEQIPLTARVLAVADVYDALTSNRSYRSAWTHEKALEVIREGSGSHFDPAVVEAFLSVIEEVVTLMAQEGQGPLVQPQQAAAPSVLISKADQAARDIQRASSELWALYEVAQTLSSSLGLQETIDILARKLEAIVPGTACLFLLRDESEEALVARAAVGVNREFFIGSRTISPRSRSVLVSRHRITYVGPFDNEDLLMHSSLTGQWTDLKSALIVPIVHQGEVLGTINLYHPNENAFGAHDRQLLETIAERAAMALYNGLLFDRTRSHAFTDPLTGLYNVRYLTQYVEERCAVCAGRSTEDNRVDRDCSPEHTLVRDSDVFALLVLDLDSFKPINDNFGHQKGDQVLRDLSKLFRAAVRDGDVVARYGGDEFLIVLEGAGSKRAQAMIERLQAAVAAYDPELIHARLGSLRIGVSIGYACYPEDGSDCAALLSTADTRMYLDKTDRKLGKLADATRVHESAEPASAPALPHAA